MADITISQLTNTTPLTSGVIPISQDGTTSSTTLAQLTALPFIPKAWVNFDGANGTTVSGEFRCTIKSSYNILKVVRTNTGMYTIYFITPMTNTNYCISGSIGGGAGEVSTYGAFCPRIGQQTTTYVNVVNSYANGAAFNSNVSCYTIYGNN